MVEEYDPLEVEDDVQTELLKKPDLEDSSDPLAVGKGTFKERRVDREIRIKNGRVEERYDFYHNGEVFYSGDWEGFEQVHLSDDGETIVVGFRKPDERHVEDWAEGYAVGDLQLELTEVWEDVRKQFENGTI